MREQRGRGGAGGGFLSASPRLLVRDWRPAETRSAAAGVHQVVPDLWTSSSSAASAWESGVFTQSFGEFPFLFNWDADESCWDLLLLELLL